MKYLIVFLFAAWTQIYAQNIDYNTKDGFIAKGYDVVAYFDNKALEGSENFTTTYDGAQFRFSSKKNLNTFSTNPKAYIPQYGGYCAYAVAKDSNKVDINPETFEIRDGKLYLFYDAWFNNTLKKWRKNNVKGLQQKADQNWEAIKFQ
ncbi:YHS domain-containing (seleno)protein [Winogradskyella ursingii]|uniref:YHS domain-containing (seleno)protein n=1 Tax=Winogradskyella ursingii TaxID=2686079 RepID=UPI0015C8F8D0|nr:YHS domain-containing (seleno)protein [Winogradskyella ursingii]